MKEDGMFKTAYARGTSWVIAVGIAAFLYLNGHSLLHGDEMATMLETRMPFGEMLRFLFVEDVHPPVYFVMLKTWLSVFGQSVFAARCFSLAGMIACAVFAGGKIRKLFDEKTAFWFVAFLMLSPVSPWLCRIVRMYSWALFFTTMAFLSAETALIKNDKKQYAFYVFFVVLASWTHYYAALACAVVALVYLFRSFGRDKAVFKRFFICNTILFAVVCPELWLLSRQNLGETHWISYTQVYDAYRLFFFGKYFCGTFLMMAAWVVGIQFFQEQNAVDKKKSALSGIIVAVCLWYVLFMLSVFWRPVLTDRYLTIAFGGLYLFFAVGIARKRTNEVLFAFLMTVSFLFSCIGEKRLTAPNAQRELYNAVKENVTNKDVLIASGWQVRLWLLYWFPDYDIRSYESKIYGQRETRFFKRHLKRLRQSDLADLLKTKRVFSVSGYFGACDTVPVVGGNDGYLTGGDFILSLEKIERCD